MAADTATPSRWTEALSHEMRRHGDALADAALARMLQDGEINRIEEIFRGLNTNDSTAPHTGYPSLKGFVESTHHLPDFVDLQRISRAEEIFIRNAFPITLILLAKSLPEGYSAPNLSLILNVSGNLRAHPYHRLLSVLQMVLNVASLGGFRHGGSALITAQKVRLLHAGIRHIIDGRMPQYRAEHGIPVNLEDMLATIMGFSYLVITGMRILHCSLTRDEEEDLFYLWRVFALLCGIHPPDEPENMAWIPDSVDDAAVFYASYAKRHFTDADRNPDGVALAQANLSMLRDMIPPIPRRFGLGLAPRVYMLHLAGVDACRRVGIASIPGHTLLKRILDFLPRVWYAISRSVTSAESALGMHPRHSFSRLLFQHLIDDAFGHSVTFTVPVTITDFHKMV
ncbi:MAG: DUF2236 domain-containing protein [Bacteroidia bacterium]|nr:DUF2236 domain-containing protein [Bacteroidia bacterium]